jgi:2-amino-4-hydroxy-6-hydroxymethyldihydropteridine diphosphokinase
MPLKCGFVCLPARSCSNRSPTSTLPLTNLSVCLSVGQQVLRHSRLYESAAAYVTDQPPFLNGAVAAATRLPPLELLRALKAIEVMRAPRLNTLSV